MAMVPVGMAAGAAGAGAAGAGTMAGMAAFMTPGVGMGLMAASTVLQMLFAPDEEGMARFEAETQAQTARQQIAAQQASQASQNVQQAVQGSSAGESAGQQNFGTALQRFFI